MNEIGSEYIEREFLEHLRVKDFPCVAAHDVASRNSLRCFVADHMGCPRDDRSILEFLYRFVDEYRPTSEGYHSAAVLFRAPEEMDEETFDLLLWQRLQALADMDAMQYNYDSRVAADVASPHFSFSIKEEAFYIIGLHAGSARMARRFRYPALVFNPHSQFERLREKKLYQKMQHIVRKRDQIYSGSINPMLADFGNASEATQYSGRVYDADWKCPLTINHGITERDTAT